MSSSPPPEERCPPCPRAVRVQRWVKVGRESAIPRSVLASSASAAETLKAPNPFYPHTRTHHHHTHPHAHTTSYALLSLLAKPRRGVNLFLAAPIIDAMPAPAHESGGGVRLIAHATERVVIKVILLCSPPDRERAMAELSALQTASSSSSHNDSTPKSSPSVSAATADSSRATHVLPLLEAMWGVNHLYMVMPWASGGDLCERILSSGRGLPHEEVRRYFTHMVKGLMHLHSCGMAHGDVSPENVVLTRCPRGGEPVAQLIDLGSCVVVATSNKGRRRGSISTNDGDGGVEDDDEEEEGRLYPFRGKPSYMPVEAVYPGVAGDEPEDPFAVDVWGLGICLYVLLTGRPLYSSPEDPAMGLLASGCAARLLAHYAEFGLELDPLAQDLIISMLHPHPSKRPCLDQILVHPWLIGVHVDGRGQSNHPPTHHHTTPPHAHDAHTHMHTEDDVHAQPARVSSASIPTRVPQIRAHAQPHTGLIAGSPPACVGGVWGGPARGSGRSSSSGSSSSGSSGGGDGGGESDTTSISTNAHTSMSMHRSGTTTATATTTTAIAARLSQHVRGAESVSYTTTARPRCAPSLMGSPVGAFHTSRFDFRCVTDELLAANADDAVATDEDMPVQARACRA